eukprot:1161504-Pelagomonas_calceolata.AAC.6
MSVYTIVDTVPQHPHRCITHAGLLFIERAAWAGAAALSAAAADAAWAWRAGDDLDDRTRARNMATASELAVSAAHAAAALVGIKWCKEDEVVNTESLLKLAALAAHAAGALVGILYWRG